MNTSPGERSEPRKNLPNRGTSSRPPLHTLLEETVGWTLDRSASLPKSQRFTFGQRLDNLALDALLCVTRAVFAPSPQIKIECLSDTLLALEQSQVLWRLVHARGWISQQQLIFISGRLDEAGRMANGWRRQQGAKEGGR